VAIGATALWQRRPEKACPHLDRGGDRRHRTLEGLVGLNWTLPPDDKFAARRTSGDFSATDLPDVLIYRNHVNPSLEKYFVFSETQINCRVAPILTRQEGRFGRSPRTLGPGMRWTRWCREASGVSADGEIAWS
jgi:hypothetical protein